MNINEIIKQCAKEQVSVRLDGENLKLAFEQEPSPELIAQIRYNKQELIDYLIENSGKISNSEEELIQAIPRDKANYLLSYAQMRMWFIQNLDKNSGQYNIPRAFEVTGNVDEKTIEVVFRKIIQRHESLRTIFINTVEGVKQEILDDVIFTLSREDLRNLSEQEKSTRVSAVLATEATEVFHLDQAPLIRAGFLRLTDSSGVLHFNVHHIVCDGWSMGVLMKEFVALYEAVSTRGSEPLPPLDLQYVDYAYWQRNWLEGEVLTSQAGYWETQLANLPMVHSLPLDKLRPVHQSFAGDVKIVELDTDVVAALKELSIVTRSTLFIVLHGAFSLLLSRYSGEQDIVIGTPVANRRQSELESLVGFFVNALVLRTQCDPDMSVVDFLSHVRQVNIDAQGHQDMPFEYLVEQLNPERSTAYNPLFQIVFTMESETLDTISFAGLELKPKLSDSIFSKFDLKLMALEHNGKLELQFEYNTDLFEPESIERLSQNFCVLLSSMVESQDKKLSDLQLLSNTELNYLTKQLNDTQKKFETNQLIQDLFLKKVKIAPEEIAICDEHGSLTYAELYVLATQLAITIAKDNDDQEELLGVYLPRGRHQAIATLAIMMAGKAFIPFDTSWSTKRCIQVLEHAGSSRIVARENIAEDFKDYTLFVSPEEATLSFSDAVSAYEASNIQTKPEALAYVIFTSGTTGKPKGVAMQHNAVVNTLIDINQRFEMGSQDCVLVTSSLSFDLAIYDIFGVLGAGGKVVFPADRKCNDPRHWQELVELHKVTLWDSVPISAKLLVEQYVQNDVTHNGSLRNIMMSGDWIPPSLPAKLKSTFYNAQPHSFGGATEAAIWSITHPINYDVSGLGRVPYGLPMSNQEFYVLDDNRNIVPVGVKGELHIGGAGLAREYLGEKEMSQNSFFTHPTLNKRLYKTGDLGRVSNQGLFEILGRRDGQIKVNGFRIELSEIQSHLGREERVKDVIVTVALSKLQGQQIRAYLVLKKPVSEEQKELVDRELREYALSYLPFYMVPHQFIYIENLPLNANGKVDSSALPEPPNLVHSHQSFPPATDTQKRVAHLWSEELNVQLEQVGLKSNFFELGGHSIAAVTLARRLTEMFGVEIELRQILESLDLQTLTDLIDLELNRQSLKAELIESSSGSVETNEW